MADLKLAPLDITDAELGSAQQPLTGWCEWDPVHPWVAAPGHFWERGLLDNYSVVSEHTNHKKSGHRIKKERKLWATEGI